MAFEWIAASNLAEKVCPPFFSAAGQARRSTAPNALPEAPFYVALDRPANPVRPETVRPIC
jgi:hypothetical protein